MGIFDLDQEEKKGMQGIAQNIFGSLTRQMKMEQMQTIRMSVKWLYEGHEIVVNAGHPEILISAVNHVKKVQHKLKTKEKKKGKEK